MRLARAKPEDFRSLSGEQGLSGYKPGAATGHAGFCKHCGVIPYGWVPSSEWNPSESSVAVFGAGALAAAFGSLNLPAGTANRVLAESSLWWTYHRAEWKRDPTNESRATSARRARAAVTASRRPTRTTERPAALSMPIASLMEPGFDGIATVMEPPDRQGHGATCRVG